MTSADFLPIGGDVLTLKPAFFSSGYGGTEPPAERHRVVARAEAVHTGKSQAVCRCDVFVLKDGEEKLCAVAQGTIAALPAAPA